MVQGIFFRRTADVLLEAGLGLDEPAFRGESYRDHPRDLKGCNDLLSITKPEVIEEIHQGFLDRTPRGRVATRRARDHFGIAAPPGRGGQGSVAVGFV